MSSFTRIDNARVQNQFEVAAPPKDNNDQSVEQKLRPLRNVFSHPTHWLGTLRQFILCAQKDSLQDWPFPDLIRPDDPANYFDILDNIVLSYPQARKRTFKFLEPPPGSTMIHYLPPAARAVAKAGPKPPQIKTNLLGQCANNISSLLMNTFTKWTTDGWNVFLHRFGDDVVFFVLCECSLFEWLPAQHTWHQLLGPQISRWGLKVHGIEPSFGHSAEETRRRRLHLSLTVGRSKIDLCTPPAKRRKLREDNEEFDDDQNAAFLTQAPVELEMEPTDVITDAPEVPKVAAPAHKTPTETPISLSRRTINRVKMFYYKPHGMCYGLPKTHILTRFRADAASLRRRFPQPLPESASYFYEKELNELVKKFAIELTAEILHPDSPAADQATNGDTADSPRLQCILKLSHPNNHRQNRETMLVNIMCHVLHRSLGWNILAQLQHHCPVQPKSNERFNADKPTLDALLAITELGTPENDPVSRRLAPAVGQITHKTVGKLLPATGTFLKAEKKLVSALWSKSVAATPTGPPSAADGASPLSVFKPPSLPRGIDQKLVRLKRGVNSSTATTSTPDNKVPLPFPAIEATPIKAHGHHHPFPEPEFDFGWFPETQLNNNTQATQSKWLMMDADPADVSIDEMKRHAKSTPPKPNESVPDLSVSIPAGQQTYYPSGHQESQTLSLSQYFTSGDHLEPDKCLLSYNTYEQNQELVEERILRFVQLNRHETMSLHDLTIGVQLKDVKWAYGKEGKSRGPPSSQIAAQNIFSKSILWLFECFIVPLLRTSFYCTETQPHHYRTFYYPRPVWRRMHEITMQSLVDGKQMLVKMDKAEAEAILSQRRFGFASLRFLPKVDGVRPIMNLKKSFRGDSLSTSGAFPEKPNGQRPQYALSVNFLLQDSRTIFSQESRARPEILASSLLSNDEVYAQVLAFSRELRRLHNGNLPELYLVKSDVKKAYDSINQAKLYDDVINKIVQKDHYVIMKFLKSKIGQGGIVSRTVNHAASVDSHLLISEDLIEGAFKSALFGKVISESMPHRVVDTQEVMESVRSHVFDTIVKDGDSYYKLVKGIPQGSTLSSLFCSLYYAHVEREKLSRFTLKQLQYSPNERSLLLRWIDDFLYITTSEKLAKEFAQEMHVGFPEYGCECNLDKSCVNFDCTVNVKDPTTGEVSPRTLNRCSIVEFGEDWIEWCGWLVGTRSLSFQRDNYRNKYQRSGDHTKKTFTENPGIHMKQAVLREIHAKLHPVLIDSQINSRSIVAHNIFCAFLSSALKIRSLHNSLCSENSHRNNDYRMIFECVLECFQLMISLCKRRCIHGIGAELGCAFELNEEDILWFGRAACLHIFRKAGPRFADVVHQLDKMQRNIRVDKSTTSEWNNIDSGGQEDPQKWRNEIVQNGIRVFAHIWV